MAFLLFISPIFQQCWANHGDAHAGHMRNGVIGSRLENLFTDNVGFTIAQTATTKFHRPGRGPPTFFRQTLAPGFHAGFNFIAGRGTALATRDTGQIDASQAGWKVLFYPAANIPAKSVQLFCVRPSLRFLSQQKFL